MLELIQDFSLNIFSSIVLIILLVSMYIKKEIYRFSSRLFGYIILAILLLLNLEILSWVFDGIETQIARNLNYIFNILFFISSGIVAGLFSSYVDYIVFKSKERLRNRLYYMHVFILLIVLIIINHFVPIIFGFSETNIYSRGPLILLGLGLVGLLMFYILFLVFQNRKRLQGKAITIYIFVLLPFFAAILQMITYGLLIMWSGMAIGVIIAYIFTETISTSRDYLTKLHTRLLIVEYVERLVQKKTEFSVIMIDLDDYKLFNDEHGHSEGDKILINFSKVLTQCFHSNSIVSRFGGDEFVIISQSNEEDILANIKHIEETLNKYEAYPLIKKLKFSYGYSFSKIDQVTSLDSLLDDADRKMYKLKSKHKNQNRRRSDSA